MSRTLRFQRLPLLLLGVVMLGLVSPMALPHEHDEATPVHRAPSCRVLNLHAGFAATPGSSALPIFAALVLLLAQLLPLRVATARPVSRQHPSRAPPSLLA